MEALPGRDTVYNQVAAIEWLKSEPIEIMMSIKVSKGSPELKIVIRILFGANKMPVFPEAFP